MILPPFLQRSPCDDCWESILGVIFGPFTHKVVCFIICNCTIEKDVYGRFVPPGVFRLYLFNYLP